MESRRKRSRSQILKWCCYVLGLFVCAALQLSLIHILPEVEHITKHCGIETECFVHGALCMSMSGQCYMSAFLGGRSGNRGLCAGPCRLPFSAAQPPREGDFHLSLKDHSHLARLPALREAGIASRCV